MHDPLHQFALQVIIPIYWNGYDLSFTNSSLFMVIAAFLAIILFSVGKRQIIPGNLQFVQEASFQFIADIVKSTAGTQGIRYIPFVFGLFLFIGMGNFLGLLPYSFTFTSHLIVTFTLALIVFTMVTFAGFFKHGLHFLRFFFPKGLPLWMAPLIVPIEFISYLSRPVSLSIRLFANMVAGHTMIKIFAGFALMMGTGALLPLSIAPVLINVAILGFECLVCFLQAYVFTMLTCIYLNDTLNLH
jgi:F-type H+-transporting ATPase subunit a